MLRIQTLAYVTILDEAIKRAFQRTESSTPQRELQLKRTRTGTMAPKSSACA